MVELTEAELLFCNIFHNFELIVLLLDPQGKVTYCNSIFYKITGWKAENIIGNNWFETCVPPEEQENLRIIFAKGIKIKHIPRRNESFILGYDGKRRLIAWNNTIIKNENDIVVGIASIGEDITEKKLSEDVSNNSKYVLEKIVQERTLELENINRRLQNEIAERQKIERTMRENVRNLFVLHKIITLMSETTELQQSLDHVLEYLITELHMDAVIIYVKDDKSDELHMYCQRNIDEKIIDLISKLTPVAQTMKTGKPFFMDHIQQRKRKSGNQININYHSGAIVPIIYQDQKWGVFISGYKEEYKFNPNDMDLFGAVCQQIGVAFANAQYRTKSKEIELMDERQRIARNIHDSVSQVLYSLSLYAKAGRIFLNEDQKELLEDCLNQVEENALRANKEMRLLLYGLQPTKILERGLTGALQIRLEQVEKRANIDIQMSISGEKDIPSHIQIELYWIVIEALNNILKYSAADTITIQISCSGGVIDLKVNDNGKGFNPTNYGTKGIGLKSMRERAKIIGGNLFISSNPYDGTTIVVKANFHQFNNIPVGEVIIGRQN